MSATGIPVIPETYGVLGAALSLKNSGLYVLPVEPDSKRPAKFLGKAWQLKSSIDDDQIKEWFGDDSKYLLGIHVGRSGVVAFDVDDYDLIPDVLREEFETNPGPWQSTRETGLRGHRPYLIPEGRSFGNSLGGLANGTKWGEIRGMNAIIVSEPSEHTKPGGRYRWLNHGRIPILSDRVANLLPQVNSDELGAGSATDETVKKFLNEHTSETKPGFRKVVMAEYGLALNSGSRHDALVKYLVQACRESRLGYYAITPVVKEMFDDFLLMFDPARDRGRFPKSEFRAALAWAVAQANIIDIDKRLAQNQQRLDERDQEKGWNQVPADMSIPDPYEPDTHAPHIIAPATEADDTPAVHDGGSAGGKDRFRTGYVGPDGRPRLNVGNKVEAMEWLRQNLGKGVLSGLFYRGRFIVHTPLVGDDGYIPPKIEGADDGPAQVRTITIDGLVSMLETKLDIGKVEINKKTNAKQWRSCLIPVDLVRRCLGSAEIGETPALRALQAITHTPVIRPDGTIFDTPGYDDVTKMLFLPTGEMGEISVPENPTREQVLEAAKVVRYPISEFPFITEDDRANWIGCALTPLLRPLVPPPYQFAVIEAPSPGSGKGFLLGILREAHGVALKPGMPSRDDEWSKVVMTMLTSTSAPIIAFDNVRGVVRSAVLEGLLTTPKVADRTLGRNNEFLEVPNDRLWAMTGNNAQIGGDLARRTLRITIDPGIPNPETRSGFKCNPVLWTRENRAKYISALLTLARAWVVAGSPMPDVKRSDDYAKWVGTVRGILKFAGFDGTFSNSESRKECSSEDEEWGNFLDAIRDSFGIETPFTAKDLYAQITGNSVNGKPDGVAIDPTILPGELADQFGSWNDSAKFIKKLGYWLKNRVGRYANGLKVDGLGKGTAAPWKNVYVYQLVSATKDAPQEDSLFGSMSLV